MRIKQDAMRGFLQENRERLRALAQKIREAAPATHAADGILPQNNSQWLTWLDQHFEAFTKVMFTEAPKERRTLNQRLVPKVQFGNTVPDSHDNAVLPPWTCVLEGRKCNHQDSVFGGKFARIDSLSHKAHFFVWLSSL